MVLRAIRTNETTSLNTQEERSSVNNVVITNRPDPIMVDIYRNYNTLKELHGSLGRINSVYVALSDISKVIRAKSEMGVVASNIESVKTMAKVANLLEDLVVNLESIKRLANEADTFKELASNQNMWEVLHGIREDIVSLNANATKIRNLDDNLNLLFLIEGNLEHIISVSSHLLAIEIVAKGLPAVSVFNENIELFKELVGFKDSVVELASRIDEIRGLQEVALNLEDRVNNAVGRITQESSSAVDLVRQRTSELTRGLDDRVLTNENTLLQIKADISSFMLDMERKFIGLERGFNNEVMHLKQALVEIKERYTGASIVNNITSNKTTTNNETSHRSASIEATISGLNPSVLATNELSGNGVEI